MGILDMYDPEVVAAMQGFGPSEDDRKKALNMGLLQGGLGILANNRGYGAGHALQNAVGQGGMQGVNAYERQIQDAERDQMRQFQTAQMMQSILQQQKLKQALSSADVPAEVKAGLVPFGDYWKQQNEGYTLGKGQKRFQAGQVVAEGAPDIQSVNLGNRVEFLDPAQMSGKSLGLGMSPGDSARLAQSDRQHAQSLAVQQAGQNKPVFHDGAWVMPPSSGNPQGGMVKTPLYAPPKGSPENIAQSANKSLAIIDEADKLLGDATGSYVGAGLDLAGQTVGVSTKGAQATAKLKALEGSLMMAQPRMEGPQSDKDAALYKQMAGQIGDPTIPVNTRRAALQTIREMHQRYGTGQPQQTVSQNSVARGHVMDGYRFKGGNPADPNAWERQ
jgi:hypothetical protein